MKTFAIIALLVSLVCQAKADEVIIVQPIVTGGQSPDYYYTPNTSGPIEYGVANNNAE